MRPQLVEAICELGWFEQAKVPDAIEDLEQYRDSYQGLDQTTRTAVIQSRIGQGRFRIDLINYWRNCAVTGCQVVDLLRASHIKSWRDSNNNERLDPFNGLLLIPNLDAAFDRGFISFANDGRILISENINEEAWLQLGINHSMNLRRVEEGHFQYLQFHREKFGFEKE
jgi:5-methylcytosine-specific restriction protein A